MPENYEELVALPNHSCVGFTDIITKKSGKTIAQVVHGSMQYGDEETQSHANMIVASKDTLHALMMMVEAFGNSENRNPDRNQAGSKALAAADAAVSKALGIAS